MNCPHRTDLPGFLVSCELVTPHGVSALAGEGRPNFACERCLKSTKGRYPSRLQDSPFLVQITTPAPQKEQSPFAPATVPPTPSYADMAVSFAKALFSWAVNDGFQITHDEVKTRRLAICEICEHFNAPKKSCRLCGCNMPYKVGIPSMTCPDNPPKWGPVETKSA